MNKWAGVTLSALGLGASANAGALPPPPGNPQQAQTSIGFNVSTRCPDLRSADGGMRSVVVFWVPRRGIQSQLSIKTSSGSDDLDAAALSCVARLRFAPAVTLGDGESVDSWQQFALTWVDQDKIDASRATRSQNSSSPVAPPAPQPAAAAVTPHTPAAKPAEPGAPGNAVTVRVCVDDKGKLVRDPAIVQSSGVDTLDQAAVKIAAAGSPYYRPLGCAQLAIKFDPN